MRYKVKVNVIQSLIMLAYWIALNYTIIPFGEKVSEADIFVGYMMNTTGGYNGSFLSVMFVITTLFSFSFFKYFKLADLSLIVRLGRDKYIIRELKSAILHTFTFSLEYWGINTILICIFCDLQMLSDLKFFSCNLLYFVSRFFYFLILGIAMSLLRILFSFNNLYFITSIFLFIAMNSLPYLMIEKGILYFSDFVNDWFLKGTFDAFEFITYAVICILVSAIFMVLTRFAFIKKDIILDEED